MRDAQWTKPKTHHRERQKREKKDNPGGIFAERDADRLSSRADSIRSTLYATTSLGPCRSRSSMSPNHHQRQHQRSGPDPNTQQEGGSAGAPPARWHQSYQSQSPHINQQGTALAPTPTRQRRLARRRGSGRQTTRIRAATSVAPPSFHIHAHGSVAVPCERPTGGSGEGPACRRARVRVTIGFGGV